MTDRASILKYAADTHGTVPDYPWRTLPRYAVLRHADNGRWYCVVLNVPKNRLGLTGHGEVDIIDIKCRPELIGALRQNAGFLPAYHMNKEHWLTIVLDGSVPAREIYTLIDLSFELTK